MESVINLCSSYSLSASSGVRSSIPLVVYSFAAWLFPSHAELNDNMAWMGTWWFFALAAVWLIVEVIADKVPAVDHVLHVAGVPIHIVIAIILALAPRTSVGAGVQAPVAVLGVGSALTFHGSKSGIRALSSACSSGTCNCVISTLEDVALWIAIILIVCVAAVSIVVAVILLALTMLACCLCVRHHYKKRKEKSAMDLEAPLVGIDYPEPQLNDRNPNPYWVKLRQGN